VIDLRRIPELPPYAFAEIDNLKLQLRREGVDVIDLGFGNPDVASPEVAVAKLMEAAAKPRNHRYSSSRGIPKLREAICDLYARRFAVELDPESEAVTTIGAKEGLAHLLWVLVEPGDAALVPAPSYPIHLFAPVFAGATVAQVAMGTEEDVLANLATAYERSRPRPRVVVASFPHNPTTTVVDAAFMQALVDFARERELVVVHDFAYADIAFDGYRPPSILAADGAREVAVELYTLSKGYSMAGWRVGFVVGNPAIVAALARLKSYLDYGTFQPIQIAATVTMRAADEYPEHVCEIYRSRRDALCDGLARLGWEVPRPLGTMFVWASIPELFREEGSHSFALRLLSEAKVSVSPGAGFGPGGDGHVRFALVENEQRIAQAVRGIRRVLQEIGAAGDGVAPRGHVSPGRPRA
jgi:alanine-synthesizing transaminase